MKIAIFTDCFLDLTGGIITAINSEKRELERRGHTVYVFTSAYPRSEAQQKTLAKSHIYPVPSCKFLGHGVTPIARRPRVIENWIMKNHPEVQTFDIFYVHHEAGCSIAGIRLGKKLHIPVIQVMHGREDVGEATIVPHPFRTFAATMLNWFHSWYLPHEIKVKKDARYVTTIARAKMWTLMVNHANSADFIITPSNHFKQKLISYGVTKPITALHHAVPDDSLGKKLAPKSIDKPKIEITWRSRVAPEKRIMPFLAALTEVKSPYHLTIYGDGIQCKKAQAYARHHHLNATFCGAVNHDRIVKALDKSNLDVLISYDYDTFGLTLIEAEAAGVPVLICDPDLAEALPKGGYVLTKTPAPADIAATIDHLIAHPDNITAMSEIMLKNRHTIKLSAKIDRLEELMQSLVDVV